VQIDINISKTLRLKITPAPAFVTIENIHSWSCYGSCWKMPTPAGVASCTPALAHL